MPANRAQSLPGTDDGQGPEHEPPGGARRGRARHADRPGSPAHPVHGRLRSGPGLDDVALRQSGDARAVVQNISFARGNSTGQHFDGGGGGAIFERGGRLRVVDSTFTGNRCDHYGPDLGGGAIRALSQYHDLPVYVVGSRFTGNVCSNGAALSSIGVSWTVLNSRFIGNRAIGLGANPAHPGTPGGGSGGAIYNDGNLMRLVIAGGVFRGNHAREGGGAVFFVSNDRTGTMSIRDSTLEDNPNDGFQTAGFPGIFFLGSGSPVVVDSTLQ